MYECAFGEKQIIPSSQTDLKVIHQVLALTELLILLFFFILSLVKKDRQQVLRDLVAATVDLVLCKEMKFITKTDPDSILA